MFLLRFSVNNARPLFFCWIKSSHRWFAATFRSFIWEFCWDPPVARTRGDRVGAVFCRRDAERGGLYFADESDQLGFVRIQYCP